MQQNTQKTLRFFAKHVARFKWLALGILLPLIATVSLGIAIPYFYKRFFDILASGTTPVESAPKLLSLLLMVVLFNGITWVLWRWVTYGMSIFQTRILANMNNECFDYLHGHSYDFFNNSFTGGLVKRVYRLTGAFQVVVEKFTWDLIPLAIRTLVIFVVLLAVNPLISFIMFGWTLFFFALSYGFALFKLKFDVARAEADTRIGAFMADSIANNFNIKLFSNLDAESKSYADLTDDWAKKYKKSWNIGTIAEAVQALLMILLEFAIFYYAIRFWEQGRLTVGDFVWIQAYLIDLTSKLWGFWRVIRALYESFADAEEMTIILNTPHEIRDAKKAKQLVAKHGKIEFENVNFSYAGKQEVLKNFNLTIKPGEKVALIGPSGGGKTTVVRLLLRLFDIQKGRILIDGQDIKKATQDSLRSEISFVPQEPMLFHRTLTENIRYGRLEASDKEVIAASKLAHCHEFIMGFPKKYESLMGERGIKLSGGERQRVAIARAILKNAPLLVLDEATSSLDSESEMLIQEALLNLMKNKTTLVIAHRLSTIMRMDRIVVLQNGQIVEEGTHGDLIQQTSGLYKRLWELQVGGYLNA